MDIDSFETVCPVSGKGISEFQMEISTTLPIKMYIYIKGTSFVKKYVRLQQIDVRLNEYTAISYAIFAGDQVTTLDRIMFVLREKDVDADQTTWNEKNRWDSETLKNPGGKSMITSAVSGQEAT